MDRPSTLRALAAAFPLVFLPHDAAEALRAGDTDGALVGLAERVSPAAAGALGRRFSLDRRQYAAAGGVAALLGALAAWPFAVVPQRGPLLAVFEVALMLRLANSVLHVVQAGITRRAAPGTGTAAAVGLPYCLLTLAALRRDGLLRGADAAAAVVAGAALMPAAALVLRAAARHCCAAAARPA